MEREGFPVRTLLVLLGVAALLWGMETLKWTTGVRAVAYRQLVPVRNVFVGAGRFRFDAGIGVRRWFKLQARVADLERQVGELQVETAKVAALTKENQSLRQQWGLGERPRYEFKDMKVVGLGEEVLLSGVELEQVRPGMAVVTPVGIFVGRVTSGDEFLVKVDTTGQVGFELAVVTQAGSRGVVRGKGSGATLESVLQAEALVAGETILTRGEGEVPGGLVVGRVGEVKQVSSQVYKSAGVIPAASLQTLETVLVIIGGKP